MLSHHSGHKLFELTWSSRVTRTVKSLRVIGLQARVNNPVNSQMKFDILLGFVSLQSGAQRAQKGAE